MATEIEEQNEFQHFDPMPPTQTQDGKSFVWKGTQPFCLMCLKRLDDCTCE